MTTPTNSAPPPEPNNAPTPKGAVGWGLLWLIGVPVPILLVVFLLRGCT